MDAVVVAVGVGGTVPGELEAALGPGELLAAGVTAGTGTPQVLMPTYRYLLLECRLGLLPEPV